MTSFLGDFIKGIDGDVSLASASKGAAEFSGYVDTGCYILNALMSGSIFGGVPNNKISALAGESATGKSFFVLSIVKHFLECNKDGAVFYFDTEAAITKDMMESRGVDTSRIAILEPDSIQKFRHQAIQILDRYEKIEGKRPPAMMVLDSLGMLSSTKELEDTAGGKETKDMTKASVIKAAFRVLTLKCAKAQMPLLVTNHVYAQVGAYVPTNEMSGGSGLKYSASTIIFLSKKKDKDGKEVVGNFIRARAVKSRLTKENSEVTVKLSYSKGLDRYYGLLELGEKHGVFKKVSTRYEMPDGSKVFEKQVYAIPEKYFTQDILVKLDEAARKEFSYGMDVAKDEPEMVDLDDE
jgi:RecA/RadA recombinase